MSKTTLIDCCIKKYAYREISEIYKEIGASPRDCFPNRWMACAGDTAKTALQKGRRIPCCAACVVPLSTRFILFFFVLGMISLATDVVLASNFARNATTAIIIFSMILTSGVIRLIQELRAKNAAQQLERLIHESITVRRAGEMQEIAAEELVVGDIVLLSAGRPRALRISV